MRLLITGSDGFIGKNLTTRVAEFEHLTFETFTRSDDATGLAEKVMSADVVVHLAGENRPSADSMFMSANCGLTRDVCAAIAASGLRIPMIFTSSAQATEANPYGESKRAAEEELAKYVLQTGNPVAIYRLPGVFGKWCRPNYNSVVATFCHNIARGLQIQIHEPAIEISLVYIDDVISSFLDWLFEPVAGLSSPEISPTYTVSLGALADHIHSFADSCQNLVTERVGIGFVRALYATYVSYLPTNKFSYPVPAYSDERGVFVEMLKTLDSGQFSYFTSHPGVTRGGHYHHSKTEKFLVIKGNARFEFRHILTNEYFELTVAGENAEIVETIPGWTHDITNIGADELIVMLWANEIFDRNTPDTVASQVRYGKA